MAETCIPVSHPLNVYNNYKYYNTIYKGIIINRYMLYNFLFKLIEFFMAFLKIGPRLFSCYSEKQNKNHHLNIFIKNINIIFHF